MIKVRPVANGEKQSTHSDAVSSNSISIKVNQGINLAQKTAPMSRTARTLSRLIKKFILTQLLAFLIGLFPSDLEPSTWRLLRGFQDFQRALRSFSFGSQQFGLPSLFLFLMMMMPLMSSALVKLV